MPAVAFFNPFLAKALDLYSLKTPENQRFSSVFRGYKLRTLARNRLMKIVLKYSSQRAHDYEIVGARGYDEKGCWFSKT